jgi:lipid-binding SYLF domain-containing protein
MTLARTALCCYKSSQFCPSAAFQGRRMRLLPVLLVVLFACELSAADPERTVSKAASALHEIMAVPLKGIPESLLADAEGVAIFPSVIKVGFVAGVERGHGVVVMRGEDRNWMAPRFITVTGGSVGWQIGASATDLVLVFKTRKSIDNLLAGKFKIGADIAAAAGPVGRRAEAATDGQLQAEIYSYSRSRGLFAGASIDGAVIALDSDSEIGYYRAGPDGRAVVPDSATQLVALVAKYSSDRSAEAAGGASPTTSSPAAEVRVDPLEAERRQVVAASDQLSRSLDDSWKRYLALPADVFADGGRPSPEALAAVSGKFETVARDPKYAALARRQDFQKLRGLLAEYRTLLEREQPAVALPPPPNALPR